MRASKMLAMAASGAIALAIPAAVANASDEPDPTLMSLTGVTCTTTSNGDWSVTETIKNPTAAPGYVRTEQYFSSKAPIDYGPKPGVIPASSSGTFKFVMPAYAGTANMEVGGSDPDGNFFAYHIGYFTLNAQKCGTGIPSSNPSVIATSPSCGEVVFSNPNSYAVEVWYGGKDVWSKYEGHIVVPANGSVVVKTSRATLYYQIAWKGGGASDTVEHVNVKQDCNTAPPTSPTSSPTSPTTSPTSSPSSSPTSPTTKPTSPSTSPSPTDTGTPTSTSTGTGTPTSTATGTPTSTRTGTPTGTATGTSTGTATGTSTSTHSSTASSSSKPGSSHSNSSTATSTSKSGTASHTTSSSSKATGPQIVTDGPQKPPSDGNGAVIGGGVLAAGIALAGFGLLRRRLSGN